PGGGGVSARSRLAWATDLSMSNRLIGFGPAKLITYLLPVTVSPIGSHRHGGGGMFTGLCAGGDQLPLNLTSSSSDTVQLLCSQPVRGGGASAGLAPAAPAENSSRPGARRSAAVRSQRIMACTPWPADSRGPGNCR